jgi:uncharacterized protein YjiS (DUF1127 family)
MRHAIEGDYRRYEQRQLAGLLGEGSRHATHFDALVATFRLWQERRRIRRQMSLDMDTFNEAMFEDVGMTREEAEREVRKPFWRPIGL